MAFSTAPSKAARTQGAAARLQKEEEEEEGEKEEGGVPHRQRSQSTSTQSTVVEVHLEEEEDNTTTHKTNVSYRQGTKVNPAMLTRGLTYTSLWPSAKDVVITSSVPPNHTSSGV